MTDLAALREALDFYRHGSPATSHFNTIKDAARKYLHLMEGAETVWWCELHEAAGHSPELPVCDIWGISEALHVSLQTPCRMVKADLHIRSESVEA